MLDKYLNIFDNCPENINTDQNLKNEISKWNFLNEDTNYNLKLYRISEEHPKKKYWLTFYYSNTSIILAKKIDKKYQQCIVI